MKKSMTVSPFEIVPLNGYIGAEIRGVQLSRDFDPSEMAALKNALPRYEVLVFREQDIELEHQIAFARRFGHLSIHPFSPNLDDKPEVIILDYSAENPATLTDQWHSDETFREDPPMATILRSRVVPDAGGDTLFASMTAAYRGLSERMKQYIHGLEAIHDFTPFRTRFTNSEKHRKKLRDLEDAFPNPTHPVVRVHPDTGRRILNVNPQFTVRIKDLKEDESRTLLQFLYEQARVPEYQLRVKWQPNTVVMWDNRAVQHYAPHDYYPRRRTMERVTIAGERPVGVSGTYSPEPDALVDTATAHGGSGGQRLRRQLERE